MKISIAVRLFLAALLAGIAVMAIGIELARWTLFDNFATHVRSRDRDALQPLLDDLGKRFCQAGSWSFIPADGRKRDWLADEWRRVNASLPGSADVSPTLGDRLGLLGVGEEWRAGRIAHPILIALISVDTVRRPIEADGSTVGFLVLASAQNPDDDVAVAFLLRQQRHLAYTAAFGLALCALAAALLAAHFRRPIRRLVDGAKHLEAGHLGARVDVRRGDELGELAETFNRMAARLDEVERSRRQWVADTSHELRTPLAVLRAQLEALQDGVRAATPDQIALMLRQVTGLNALVDDLHQLASGDAGALHYDRRRHGVWAEFVEVLGAFSERIRAANLELSVGPAPTHAIVEGDASRLRQVLTNLIENSIRYTAPGGRIEVSAAVQSSMLVITIEDSAPGVDAAAMAKLGERFFRADASRSRRSGGSGLGLALARQIVHAHAGRLAFAASALGGLRVTLALPLDA